MTENIIGKTAGRKGTLFVVSGPSGAGKGTLCSNVFKHISGIDYSVSCTTREPREGETDGVEYHFISEDDFEKHVVAGDFLEWAHVHKHRYGTLKSEVQKALDSGRDILLEIDVQGALQVKGKMPEAVTIFIAPPSFEVLEKRLRGRHSDSEEQIKVRLATARKEMEYQGRYDFVVVNDDLSEAVTKFSDFIKQHRQ